MTPTIFRVIVNDLRKAVIAVYSNRYGTSAYGISFSEISENAVTGKYTERRGGDVYYDFCLSYEELGVSLEELIAKYNT